MIGEESNRDEGSGGLFKPLYFSFTTRKTPEQCVQSLERETVSNFDFRVQTWAIQRGYEFSAEKRYLSGRSSYTSITASGTLKPNSEGHTVVDCKIETDFWNSLRLWIAVAFLPIIVVLVITSLYGATDVVVAPLIVFCVLSIGVVVIAWGSSYLKYTWHRDELQQILMRALAS